MAKHRSSAPPTPAGNTRRPTIRAFAVLAAFSLLVVLGVTTPAVASDDHPATGRDGKQVADAGETFGSNGLYIGPDDKVYIASVAGDEISVHDFNSGYLLDRLGPEDGVNGPDDLFITGDGTIYWTELFRGNVGMLKPNGESKVQFVGPGVNPITMSDDGRLFVSRIILGDGLYELDPDLEDEPQLIKANTGLSPDAFPGLNGFDFGPDGRLYAPLFGQGVIVSIDVDQPDPDVNVVAEGFALPTAVAFSPAGELHAVDQAKGQVVKVDTDGTDHEVLIQAEGTLDNLAFDRHGRIFAAEGTEGTFVRWSPNGEVRRMAPNGLTGPGGLTFGSDGRLWVADTFSLRGYGEGSTPEVSFHDRFLPPGAGFAGAGAVAADGDNLILAWSFGNSVQVFDPATGAVVQDIRTLDLPVNAIRHGGAIAAAQAGAANVVNADTGDLLLQSEGGLPLGLASDGTTLYVSDWALGTISAVAGDGVSVLASGLNQPEGIAIAGDQLLVVEAGSRTLTAIDPNDGSAQTLITDLNVGRRAVPGFLPIGHMSDVAIHPETGDIYISSDTDRTVYRFDDIGLNHGDDADHDDGDGDDGDHHDDDDQADLDGDGDHRDRGSSRIVVKEGESVQSAIDLADPGTTIVVRGHHTENIWIHNDGITLTGAGTDSSLTLPDEPAPSQCDETSDTPVLICVTPEPGSDHPTISEVRVHRLTLNNPEGTALMATFTENLKVSRAVVPNPGCAGILVMFTDRAQINRNTVTGSSNCNGIDVRASARIRVNRNITTGNQLAGITVQDSSDVRISRNEMTGNCIGMTVSDFPDARYMAGDGVYPSQDVRISNNSAIANNRQCFPFGLNGPPVGGTGIAVSGGIDITITGNTTNENVIDLPSVTASGILVQDFPQPHSTSAVSGLVVKRNEARDNRSMDVTTDLTIRTEGIEKVSRNDCDVSSPDPSWCGGDWSSDSGH